MIKVKHLNKAFGSIPVLRDLNLTVNGPLVLMGPSGCGKTTLLRILMGLETPDSGTVQGVGNIGAVFQESRLCPQLTAVEEKLGSKLFICKEPEIVGALGAALFGLDK